MLADAKCWIDEFYKVKPDQPAEVMPLTVITLTLIS
jgi:hypothetical protein